MDTYKISVIVPSYKPGAYLWQCLESLRGQTLPAQDFEVLVVLNGCDEPWKSGIEQYIEGNNLDNFRFIHTLTPGVSNARNLALDAAKGEYIAFIDDDDFVSPTYLEELYDQASRYVVGLCYPLSFQDGTDDYTPYYITKEYKTEVGEFSFEKAKRYFSGPVYKLIHRDIIGGRRFDTSFKNGEDSIFMFAISDRFNRVAFTSQNAVYYRRVREGSALLRKKSKSEILKNCLNMVRAYTRIYFKHPMRYKMGFYITRLLGAFHGAIEQIQLNRR